MLHMHVLACMMLRQGIRTYLAKLYLKPSQIVNSFLFPQNLGKKCDTCLSSILTTNRTFYSYMLQMTLMVVCNIKLMTDIHGLTRLNTHRQKDKG